MEEEDPIRSDAIRARKRNLRQRIYAHWKAICAEEYQNLSRIASERVAGHPRFLESSVVFAFAPDRKELDYIQELTHRFPEKCWAFSRIEGGMMHFYADDYHNLVPGSLGVLETQSTHSMTPTASDIILCPGLAFGKDGQRMGRGGGFYDKFLSQYPSTYTLAVIPQFCSLLGIPAEPHDRCVNEVIII